METTPDFENTIDLVEAEIRSRETRDRLIAAAASRLGNRADAEDCVQDALLLASKNAAQWQGRSTARAWLFRIVENACRMRSRALRRMRRGGDAVHVPLDDAEIAVDPAGDPESLLLGRALCSRIEAELARMPARDATLFERHVVEDRPLRALALDTALSAAAVKARVFRVRRRLVERLVEAGDLRPAALGVRDRAGDGVLDFRESA